MNEILDPWPVKEPRQWTEPMLDLSRPDLYLLYCDTAEDNMVLCLEIGMHDGAEASAFCNVFDSKEAKVKVHSGQTIVDSFCRRAAEMRYLAARDKPVVIAEFVYPSEASL